MKVNILAFGIARDILGSSKDDVELQDGSTIGQLKQLLFQKYSKFADLASISFAVNEEYQEDDFQLNEDDEVVIIPPVSGG
ncbi:MAG: molybdopterin converting factor subunit 1 [Bacteroidota bacterium]